MSGRILALLIATLTVLLIAVGTLWPADVGTLIGVRGGQSLAEFRKAASPEEAVGKFMENVRWRDWPSAYALLANADELDRSDLVRDLGGSYGSLRSYSGLESWQTEVLDRGADQALVRVTMKWAAVVGAFYDSREVPVVRSGDRWRVAWPAERTPRVPPQVIPVNYLRWDVIYRGAEDDWGAQDVQSPRVRIVAMNPVQRGDHVVILGELLNEDTVPAYVNVGARLLDAEGRELARENSFDKIMHILLPKQVTPFRIDFPGMNLDQVDSVRMEPVATLVAASADPVIVVEDQQLKKEAKPSLTGQLVNQSGQIVNIAQVLATFYDRNGQILWVSDGYVDRALLPQTEIAFAVDLPGDLLDKVGDHRVVVSPYSADRYR